jgi:hypothetical protein
MNKDWVEQKIAFLSSRIGSFRANCGEFNFEPTDQIYDKLESGEELDLQFAAMQIGKHLGLTTIPLLSYEWGIKMDLEIAGQINTNTGTIRIPFYYVGKKYPLGTILAHEMTHAFLYSNRIWLDDVLLNEMFTDLSAVFLGLGKIYLNGVISEGNDCGTESMKLSYLSPWLIGYCYNRINQLRSIDEEASLRNLLPQAKNIVKIR